jgi:hypothetical protein
MPWSVSAHSLPSCYMVGFLVVLLRRPFPSEGLGLQFHGLPLFITPVMLTSPRAVSNMLNKLSGQPESYEKKYDLPLRLLSLWSRCNNT